MACDLWYCGLCIGGNCETCINGGIKMTRKERKDKANWIKQQ